MVPGDGRIYRNLKDFLALLSNDSPLVNHAVSIRYASTPRPWSTRNCVKDRQVLSVITWRHNVQQKSYWTRPKKSIKSVPRAGSAQRFVLRQGPATRIYFFRSVLGCKHGRNSKTDRISTRLACGALNGE